MNNTYNDYILHKNHFYMFYKQVINSYNDNKYGKNFNTYLIDIDNYDILKELNRVSDYEETTSIYKEDLVIDYNNIVLYENIKNIHINLDYIKRKIYNYNTLTSIERDYILFITNDEKILKKNKNTKEVIEMFKWLLLKNESLLLKHMGEGIDEIEEVRKHNLWLGEQRGIEKGANQEKISIAKSMKKSGESIDKIIKFTGLSKDKIMML